MLFACTLDAIFELLPIVRELLGHCVGPARHIATDRGPNVYDLTNLEFMRGHRHCFGTKRRTTAKQLRESGNDATVWSVVREITQGDKKARRSERERGRRQLRLTAD